MWLSPSFFTGKERDEETGYGYFGARYMDHALMTMWLSVDPMADKYPSISPYNYCMWNPAKLVDPDGREVVNVHTRNVNKSKAKIAELQNQINNCSDKKQLKHLNKKLNTEQKTLNREMEYEKIVNTAIQDLKDYGMDDEFNKLDNLTDINGNKVDVYVEMVDNLGGFNGNCGEHRARIASNGPVSSDMGDNSVHIFLSHKYRFIAGKTLAHEGGHALWDVQHPAYLTNFYAEHPTEHKTGHEKGNLSGIVANKYENGYVENRKRAMK